MQKRERVFVSYDSANKQILCKKPSCKKIQFSVEIRTSENLRFDLAGHKDILRNPNHFIRIPRWL